MNHKALEKARQEIEQYKREIKLPDYAFANGYCHDKNESTKSYLVLRAGADKIAVSLSKDANPVWLYYSFRDPEDNGTIIDFVQRRNGLHTIREVRLHLRKFLGRDLSGHGQDWATPKPIEKDRAAVLRAYMKTSVKRKHPFLQSRGLTLETINSDRFFGRIRTDYKQNAVFPIFDRQGVCGLEKRNVDFKGCQPAGYRGLWISRVRSTDKAIVVCESAVDALSYYQLFDDGMMRYASLTGSLSEDQVELLAAMLDQMGPDAYIVDATDNDLAGNEYSAKLNRYFHTRVIAHKVGFEGDWNDVVKDKVTPPSQ